MGPRKSSEPMSDRKYMAILRVRGNMEETGIGSGGYLPSESKLGSSSKASLLYSSRVSQSFTASAFAFAFGCQLSGNFSPVFLSLTQRIRYLSRVSSIMASTSYSWSGSNFGRFGLPTNSC